MSEISGALLRLEILHDLADMVPEVIDGALGGFSQSSFEFGEEQFDWVEIGRIGWQQPKLCTSCLDRLTDTENLMGRQVIHDDDLAWPEGWCEELLDIGDERHAIHRAVHNTGGSNAVMAETRDERRRLPVAVRDAADQALATVAASTQARHVGRGPGFIDEDQPGRIKTGLAGLPDSPRGLHVRPFLFGGVRRFF